MRFEGMVLQMAVFAVTVRYFFMTSNVNLIVWTHESDCGTH